MFNAYIVNYYIRQTLPFQLTLFVHFVLISVYVVWLCLCNPVSIGHVYGFTIVSDLCSTIVSALIEMSTREVLLDISVVVVCLLSSVLRFVASDCEGCNPDESTDSCSRNACYEDSARGILHTGMFVLPLIVVALRSRSFLKLTY